MVTNITSLTGNGLKDWLIQRISAIYFAIYALFLLSFLSLHPQITYQQWHALFHCRWFQIATIVFFVAFLLHTWIGIWTVTTDYIKGSTLRLVIQLLVRFALLGQLIWCFLIVWGQ